MRLKDHYDWIVLGHHPGALLSACIMAKLGYSVLVLKIAPEYQARLTPSGQCLDPEPNYLLGLGHVGRANGLLAQCLSRLGVSVNSFDLIKAGEEVFPQVLTASARVNLGLLNEGVLRKELERELGPGLTKESGLVGALCFSEPHAFSYWRVFPEKLGGGKHRPDPAGRKSAVQKARRFLIAQSMGAKGSSRQWFSHQKKISYLEQGLGAEELADLCSGLWYAITSVEAPDPLLIDLVHALVLARTGATFKGGMRAYREFLLSLAKSLGAQVPEETQCRRFFVENQRIIGVQITHRGKMIGAQGAILGCSLSQANRYLYVSGKTRVPRLRRPPEGAAWRFTLALTVHREAIPPGVTSRLVWKEKGAPALEIEVADPADYQLGQTAHRLIFLRTWMPFHQKSLSLDYQKLIASRMFRQLAEIFPFLEYHVVRVFPDFRKPEAEVERDFREVYGFTSPDQIPDNLRSVRGPGVGCFSGVDQLYVASGESYPALGSFGATVAALESVNTHLRRYAGAADQKFLNLWNTLE